jgi:ribonuclease HI
MVQTTPLSNRWQAPPEGFVKINWDAAVDSVNCQMGIGIVARNSLGEVVASMFAPKSYIVAPDIAEAVAALRAAKFGRELSFTRVVLEGDALQIVQALKSSTPNWSSYGHLVEEARDQLNGMHTWRVNHVRRHLNGAAHRLAKEALTLSEELISGGEVPPCIYDIISMERL